MVEYENMQFDVRFQAIAPDYAACQPDEAPLKDPGILPRHPGYTRLVSKHPSFKVTKTACVGQQCCFSDAVRTLYPDMVDATTWKIYVGDVEVDPKANMYGVSAFTIEWTGYRPFAPSQVQVAAFTWPIDPSNATGHSSGQSHSARWIRSPFKIKPDLMKIDGLLPVMQVAASFVSHSMLNTSIMCQMGAKIVDPATLLNEIPVDQVLSFKIAPLVGGAKHAFEQV